MTEDKDIRFTSKKVDESWKERVQRDRGNLAAETPPQSAEAPSAGKPASRHFLNLLTSLGYQAMMHLGEIPNPEGLEGETNLEAAREIIDLLIALKDKTEGNLSAEEKNMLHSLVPELQMKFTQKA